MRRLDGLLQGDYRTFFRGVGLDLAGLREYQPGDDVRHIDWNITARLSTPYVRQYNEDRDVTVWFLLDLSRSVDFGSGGRGSVTKRDVIVDLLATLAGLFTRRGNRAGALFFDGGNVDVLPAGGGRLHLLNLIDDADGFTSTATGSETQLALLLDAAQRLVRRRSLIFLMTDFATVPGWERSLGTLAQRHEVISVQVSDPAEERIPRLGLVYMEDAETGEQLLVDAGNPAFQRRFAAEVEARSRAIEDGLVRAGVDGFEVSTEDDMVATLLQFVQARARAGTTRRGVAR
jgi:uncharacterized protein (DUF58 family)